MKSFSQFSEDADAATQKREAQRAKMQSQRETMRARQREYASSFEKRDAPVKKGVNTDY